MNKTKLTIPALWLTAAGSWTSLYLQAGVAAETIMDDWHIFGSNTFRASVYDAHGPGAASPYPFEGEMFFDEFNIYLDRQNSRYDQWRAEISGVINDDDYRSRFDGVVPERLNLTRENGDSHLPYRLEVGDYFSYYSFLTLQRSLKGMQVELQPLIDAGGRRHSFIFTAGADESDWRDLTFEDNFTSAASWLMQDALLGALSMNFVHNFRDNSNESGTLDRSQYVFSVAGEKPFSWLGHSLLLEGEAAHFSGDHNGLTGAASGQNRDENGFFLDLSGRSTTQPWDYRLRFDYYGQDFRPQGAVVTPDRRSVEVHSGWRFDSGVRMRARVQRFEDNFETSNELTTRTYGVNFNGPLLKSFMPDVSGSLDAFIQNQDDEMRTVSLLARTFSLDLNKPLPYDWNGRLGVFIQNIDDSAPANADNLTRQVNFSADHAIEIANFSGFVTPGLLLRTVRKGGNDSTDWGPAIALRVRRLAHEIGMDYNSLLQNRSISLGAADINTHTLNLDYRYTRLNHIFGFEGNFFGRDPGPGESTEAYRLSVFWTWNFDRPPSAVQPVARTGPAVAPAEAKLTIAGLAPGLTRNSVDTVLMREGITGGVTQAGYEVYEYPVFPMVIRRQRLALEYTTGILTRSGVIIEFDDVGDVNSVSQTFEGIRQDLIRELGPPVRTRQEGEFTANFVSDVNDQRLVRITEWMTEKGIIRFGIPRRLDGRVRMEIQYATSFPQPGETLWSMEAVR